MKKRKAPITLISVFIICGVAAVIVNLLQLNPDAAPRPETSDLSVLGVKDKLPEKDLFSVADKSSDALPKAKHADMPSIMEKPGKRNVQSMSAPKPMPSDTQVSGQWYAPEHAKTTNGG